MKHEVVPAIMPRTWRDLEQSVVAVVGAAKLVQVDIMDGVFVGGKTWPYPKHDGWLDRTDEGLPLWEKVDYEFDLMITAPEETLFEWISLGPAAIVIHYEAVRDWEKLVSEMAGSREYIHYGISFDDETAWEAVAIKMEYFDYVQCMGIDEIGAQGNAFSERVFDNIAAIQDTHPDILISVDGSVNKGTIRRLRDAGVSRFVAGSAVFGATNPRNAIHELEDLIQ